MVFSNGPTVIRNLAALASDWQFAGGWLRGIADESGSNPHRGKESLSTSTSWGRPHGPTPQPLILLLAEDNPPDALLVRQAIRMENLPLEVHLAQDGERAIDFIAAAERDTGAPIPQLLLLDLNLPKIHGLEVLLRIRASDKLRNIPVLVVTSSDSPTDRIRAAQLGASYFRKPTAYDEFLKVGTVLRQFLTANGLL